MDKNLINMPSVYKDIQLTVSQSESLKRTYLNGGNSVHTANYNQEQYLYRQPQICDR